MFSKFDKSIVWKITLPVPICLIAMIVGLWFTIPAFTTENVIQDAIASARGTVNQFKVIRGYYTKNVIKKALESKRLKPHFDHKGKPGVIPLPATFIHDVSKELETADTKVKLYSAFPFPNRKGAVLDTFQTEAWAFLKDNPDEIFSRQETREGAAVVRVAIADKMVAQGCVNCHNTYPGSPKTDWKLGDVRGVLEVSTPIAAQLAAGNTLSNKILLLVLVAGVALAAITFYIAHRVSRPLVSLNDVARALASGDKGVEIPNLERADEAGRLSASVQIFKDNTIKMDQMAEDAKVAGQAAEEKAAADIAERVDNFESAVSNVLRSVSAASDELNSTATSLSATAERSSNQTEAAISATQQASSNVQTVAAASEELSSSISEINRQVSDAAAISIEAVDAAEQTNASVLGLSEAGQKIGDVVNLISDIANQTNLLALNATIEAARAGEAGKGFAVVASEVKGPATQTAKATEEISTQITSMQQETEGAVKAIQNISEVIGRVNEISGSIASGIEQQTDATTEISRNAQEAAKGTEEVSSNIGGVSQSAAETGSAANQVLSAASELSEQSGSLRTEVQSFLNQMRAG